jgi:hypothetical protein
VHVCSCRSLIAFSVVETSVGKDGAVVGGGGISGVSDTPVEPVGPVVAVGAGAVWLVPGPAGPEPPPEHPATASSRAAGSSALFLIVPPEEWHECRRRGVTRVTPMGSG